MSPWVDNGHLNEFLRHNPNADRVLLVSEPTPLCLTGNSRFETENIMKALDVAKGVQYLHQEDVIHGDLKGVRYFVPVFPLLPFKLYFR